MGNLIYITGGARSGKSTFAENLALEKKEQVIYIATLKFIDEEMRYRIEKHRERRAENYKIFETYKDFSNVFKNLKNETILLDCITNMVNNFMFEEDSELDNISSLQSEVIEKNINIHINSLIKEIKRHKGTSILVSNELGMGLVPNNALGRYFRDIAGRINQQIAKEADEVYFVVSGIPMKIKGV